jgi:RNA polymerase sigma-70 factor, ECF subfamily
VASRFLDACRTGDVAALLDTLAPDVVLTSDGGGKVSAARRPIHGADRVLRFLEGLNRQAAEQLVLANRWFNGTPGHILVALVLDIADGTIHSIEAIRNPEKLAHLDT